MATSDPTATAALRDWPCTNADHLGMCSDDHVHAAHIPYEGTDCTADEAVEAVKAVRATAAPSAITVIREALAAPHLQDDPASARLTPQERLENRASVIYWALFDAGLLTEANT